LTQSSWRHQQLYWIAFISNWLWWEQYFCTGLLNQSASRPHTTPTIQRAKQSSL